MIYGYKEILNDMISSYENETGEQLWKQSETYRRFEAVASELYALSCFANRNLRQAFAQTATGSFLDLHGQLYEVERKAANPARGTLTFCINEAADEDIEIPVGTVCSVKDNPYIQFRTTESAVIPAGELSAECNAVSLEAGSRYNVKSGEVTVMVNAPVGIGSVVNNGAFIGGKDAESDSHLRKRIMSHYGTAQNGVNNTAIENLVLKNDFVRDCYIPNAPEPGFIMVYVSTVDDIINSERVTAVAESIDVNALLGCDVFVDLSTPSNFTMSIELHVKPGYQNDNIGSRVEELVTEYCRGIRIGRSIEFSDIANAIAGVEGVKSFRISSPQAIGDVIYCLENDYLFLDGLAVEVIE